MQNVHTMFMKTLAGLWLKGQFDRPSGKLTFYWQPRVQFLSDHILLLDGDGNEWKRFRADRHWHDFGDSWVEYGSISLDSGIFDDVPPSFVIPLAKRLVHHILGLSVLGYGDTIAESVQLIANPNDIIADEKYEYSGFDLEGLLTVHNVSSEDALAIDCTIDFGDESSDVVINDDWWLFLTNAKLIVD